MSMESENVFWDIKKISALIGILGFLGIQLATVVSWKRDTYDALTMAQDNHKFLVDNLVTGSYKHALVVENQKLLSEVAKMAKENSDAIKEIIYSDRQRFDRNVLDTLANGKKIDKLIDLVNEALKAQTR